MRRNDVELYKSWRNNLLNIIGNDICKKCVDPRKNKAIINLEEPLKCECRCERVETVLTSASNLDSDIQLYMNTSH